MIKKLTSSEMFVPAITLLSDIIAIEVSFLFSYWLRFNTPLAKLIPFELPGPTLTGYIVLSLMVIPIWLFIFQSRKMYRARRVVFILDEFFLITRLVTFGIIFSFGLIFFYRVFPYSRLVFVIIWAVSIILITVGRYFVVKIEKSLYNKGKAVKNTIIAGNNKMACDIYENFTKHKYAGYNIIGYLGKEDQDEKDDCLKSKKRLGSYSDILDVVKQNNVEIVMLSVPSTENNITYELMKKCEGENIEFLLAPDFLEMITSSVRVQEIDSIPFLKLKTIPLGFYSRGIKRIFDLTFALVVFLFTSPIFIILAALVKFSSRGPVFYKQERLSMTGKKFYMIKFRSMVQDAEKHTGAVFVSKNDSRYTPVGKFLRKFSLDELPQLINVLRGEMSIVGPRPEREHFIELMKDRIPKYMERHLVKCGITGWAQVNGLRGSDTSLEERIQYDIYYIENWSVVFDLKIILKTIKEMFFSKAAF